VDPHGGGLDAYGCYHNQKAGGYAIAVYSPGNPSQEEILKNFRQRRVMERPKRMRRNKLKFPTPKELQEILKRLTSEVANEPIATHGLHDAEVRSSVRNGLMEKTVQSWQRRVFI
jgi:hypothetical protein